MYYVFNVNSSDGFVIVAAEDAESPILGYSNTGQYVIPAAGNNVDFWMKKRSAEIQAVRTANLTATPEITAQWTSCINNTLPAVIDNSTHKTTSTSFPSSTAYLVQSTWDQQYAPYPYNYFCPPTRTGSTASTQSVTGCVATAMAQIMRYWSYPPKGVGSSSYCDCTSSGYTENYGTLASNYAGHNYNWSAMALTPSGTSSVNTSDTEIARVMADAGISVDMDYSPSGSGSYVITADNPTYCAQISYPTYFGYTKTILHGMHTSAMSATAWQDTMETELNKNRPIQYFGTDPTNGGHTWVCDGYNSSNDFHMNWGWSGSDDGWYSLSALSPTGSGYTFSQNDGALIGILPPPATPVANFVANVTTIPVGGKVNFTDLSTGFPTSWSWTFTGAVTTTSTAQNPSSIQYNTAGNYTVTEKVTNSAGSNTATKTAYIHVVSGQACDTLSNLPSPDTNLTWYGTGNGYVTGCYGDTVQKEAEYFSTAPPAGYTIGSAYIYFAAAYSPTAGRSVIVNVYDNTGTGGAPGAIKATQTVTLSSIQAADRHPTAGPTLVTFTTPATVTTPYYIGVDFTTCATNYKTDTVAIITDTNNQGAAVTAWQYDVAAKYSLSGWYTVAAVWGINISNAIWPIMCTAPTDVYTTDLIEGVKIYPNPTSGIINAELNLENQSDVNVEVYNMLGQVVQTAHWSNVMNDTYTLNLSAQAPGMYFVKLITDKATITRKVIINR